jgi:hypothetical protein
MHPYAAVDGEHDTADGEPSLGSLDQHDNQERWAAGCQAAGAGHGEGVCELGKLR